MTAGSAGALARNEREARKDRFKVRNMVAAMRAGAPAFPVIT
jgi:hypothetical protein